MKIIINESQLRLIVENENKDENLINLTGVYESGVSPNKWDDMFEHINNKKGGKYDGYYIDGDVFLNKPKIPELKYLVRVGNYLEFSNTPIKSLPMLEYVGGSLFFVSTQIDSLPMLTEVGNNLALFKSKIESLPMLTEVGGYLDLRGTPLSKTTTEKELRKQINVGGEIFLWR